MKNPGPVLCDATGGAHHWMIPSASQPNPDGRPETAQDWWCACGARKPYRDPFAKPPGQWGTKGLAGSAANKLAADLRKVSRDAS